MAVVVPVVTVTVAASLFVGIFLYCKRLGQIFLLEIVCLFIFKVDFASDKMSRMTFALLTFIHPFCLYML